MRRVRCYECGKRYDFDVDDFCPRCGAFNQPDRTSRIGADGSVIRVDGLNEVNHREAFAHAELHEENRERRNSGLSKGTQQSAKTIQRQVQTAAKRTAQRNGKNNLAQYIKWFILAIIGLNILSSVLFELL